MPNKINQGWENEEKEKMTNVERKRIREVSKKWKRSVAEEREKHFSKNFVFR